MKPREAFLRELAERAGEPKRLGRSQSMFELGCPITESWRQVPAF
jgi:hypothetical protein